MNKYLNFMMLLLLPSLVFALYFPVLWHSWTWDDAAIVQHVYRFSPWEYFFLADAWQALSAANLTPWVSLSFEIDFALFGLAPQGYYWHQLLSLSLVAMILFLLLRLWLSPLWSLAGVLLWLLSAPTQTLANQLMTRHYVEGLGFALLALLFYIKALRDERWHWLLGSTVFYALACTAKEIYVPLILLLPWLPESTVRRRLNYAIPLIVIAALYVLWRFHMLGVSVGGYGHPLNVAAASLLPLQILQVLLGQTLIAWLCMLACVFAVMLYALWQYRAARWLLPLVLCLTLVPLMPAQHLLADAPTYRLLILPSAVFAVGWVVIMGQATSAKFKRLSWGLFVVLLAVLMTQNKQTQKQLQPHLEQFAAHARFIQQAPSHHVLLQPLNWTDTRLRWLQETLSDTQPPLLVFDLIEIDRLEGKQFFVYETQCACMQNITADLPRLLQDWRKQTRPQAPLSIQFSEQNRLASWQFSPYAAGTYRLINPAELGLIVLPAQGRTRVTLPEIMRFRLRYDAPEGWHTYSPWLHLEPAENGKREITWSR